MEHSGPTVTRLIRVSYGPFHLGNLPPGAVDEVKARVLRDQIPGYFAAGGALTEGEAGAEARRAPPTRGRSTKPAARKQTEGRAGGAARPMTGGPADARAHCRTDSARRAGLAPARSGARGPAPVSPDDQPAHSPPNQGERRRVRGADLVPRVGCPSIAASGRPRGGPGRPARFGGGRGESAGTRGGVSRTRAVGLRTQDRSAGPRGIRAGTGAAVIRLAWRRRRPPPGAPPAFRRPAARAKAGLGQADGRVASRVLRAVGAETGTGAAEKSGRVWRRAARRTSPHPRQGSSGPAADAGRSGGKASAGKTGKPASGRDRAARFGPSGRRAAVGAGMAGIGRGVGRAAVAHGGRILIRDPGVRPAGRQRGGGGDAGHRRRP